MADNPNLAFLQQRNAAARLLDPAPSGDELEAMFQAAFRVPDHGRLQPWRFLQIEGAGRERLGDLFVSAASTDGEEDSEKLAKIRSKPLRAPMIVVVIACISEHPKAPPVEQRLSAGCAAHNLLLAAEALGYAGIWRTGGMAFNRHVMDGLGLVANEEIVGFLYIGSRNGKAKPIAPVDSRRFVSQWPPASGEAG